MSFRLWEGDNTHFIEVEDLTLQPEGTLVSDATVTARVLHDGSVIQGVNDPISLSADQNTDGRYTATIPAGADIEAGKEYVVEISADTGSSEGFWKERITAYERPFT